MSDVDLMIAGAYDKLLTQIAPEDAAEMMIEAARDAEQTGFDIYKNPYTSGSIQSLVYINECQKQMMIEAARDAEQTGFDIYKNPYTSGSMQSLMYINECQKHWIASVAKATETRKT